MLGFGPPDDAARFAWSAREGSSLDASVAGPRLFIVGERGCYRRSVDIPTLIETAFWIALLAWWLYTRGRPGPDELLAKELGLKPSNPFTLQRGGRTITTKVSPATSSSPPRLRVTASVDEGAPIAGRGHVAVRPAMVLHPRDGIDRLGERAGLNEPVPTGDAAFDAAFYLDSSAPPEDVQKTLADPGLRERLRALLGKAERVELDPAGLSATFTGQAPTPAAFEDAAALVTSAAAALPLFDRGQAAQPTSSNAVGLGLLLAILSSPFTIVAGVAAPVEASSTAAAARWALLAWALSLVLIARAVRGRTDGLRRAVMLGALTFFGLAAPLFGGLLQCNTWLDGSPRVEHATTVLGAWESENMRGTKVHSLEVVGWRRGQAPQTLSCSHELVAKATKGAPAVVTTHAGRLGWEWVSGVRLGSR